jgi:AbiEi antitoxin C-terminal domain
MFSVKAPHPGSQRQSARAIPSRLSAVVEYLELFQPNVLTLDQLGSYLNELGIQDDPAKIAHDLQRLGWLLPLRTRGRWEFAPAARAGALPSGDPFVELRATLQRRDLPVALAYDSAAWLQGLSTRQPHKHVLATYPSQKKLPPALSDFRVTRIWGALEPEYKKNLPVWRVPTLLAKMAIEPHYFRDWPNVMEWLEEAFKRADAADLERELDEAPETARVRLAYLANRANFKHLADELMQNTRPRGVTYLGRDRTRGRFVRDYNLVDSLLVPSVKS